MKNTLIYQLGDIAGLAQAQFQATYQHIDPVIGINTQLRKSGYAVDIMTIDCHVSKKRMTLLLEDAKPETAGYQFGRSDQDPSAHFEPIKISELTQQGFFDLMVKALVCAAE
ncbi:hypothetical protein [Marinagarivorans algicola]|uniref:hypothetical protein n=1 Tax=Marinagarivorans algicola TaxID=1513270 RepID=UPI0012E1783C|nr:hypothetical protein [Marinagarivorans algicola]